MAWRMGSPYGGTLPGKVTAAERADFVADFVADFFAAPPFCDLLL
jgi:hypothetical protein